jgi:hypothetical protein
MNRTLTATSCRAWTRAWHAMAFIAGTTLATGTARAQDHAGTAAPIQVEEPSLPAPTPVTQRVITVREDGPRVITDWHEGEPIPPGYHPAQRTRTGAIIASAVTLGALYFLNALIAAVGTDVANATNSKNTVTGLFVPVFGPFITITQSSSATGDLFLILDGAGQATCATILVWAVTSPQTLLMRDGYAGPRFVPRPMLLGKNGAGFGLSGTF